MDITLENFPDTLPNLIKDIKNAEFIAVDTEFTGVSRTRADGINRKHTIEERYDHCRNDAEKFQLLQLGICTVAFDKELESYVCRPYCFGVNPSAKWGLEREFVIQASAAKFLVSNGLDLTKVFVDGIPYLREDEEKALIEKEDKFVEGSEIKEDIIVEPEQAMFVEKFVGEVQAWLNDPNPEYDFLNVTGEGNDLNNYERRIIHQTIRSRFPNLSTTSKMGFVQITQSDPEAEKAIRIEKSNRTREEIDKAVGLRRVMDALRSSHKPLIGHNLFIDLIHLYQTFVSPLPPTLQEFTNQVHRDFPCIIDTKLIASCGTRCHSSTTTLQNLSITFETLSEPRIRIDANHQPKSDTAAHDAGFDALITSRVMMQMMVYLNSQLESCGGDREKAAEKLATFINSMGLQGGTFVSGGRVPSLVDEKTKGIWKGLANEIRLNGTQEGVVTFGPI
ncbi:ribonuclease CAF1 [Ascodesmis nigricans]|uniref:Ribonuclease CAF1 n=1 Tax=Ascodesmis nigricans TaxID=341454 RepID=A0A4S2MWC3_9PEZI|nr:ribonuclease CAF1 [Ascodesmis nigricans]